MLKAPGSVYPDLSFLPTGGISLTTLTDNLQLPSVIACGGSWLTPASAIEKKDYVSIAVLAAEAFALVARSDD